MMDEDQVKTLRAMASMIVEKETDIMGLATQGRTTDPVMLRMARAVLTLLDEREKQAVLIEDALSAALAALEADE